MHISKLLDPKIDYVFKRIFGFSGNEEITQALISSILKRKVSNVELDCDTILEKDLLDDKVGILDIRARIDSQINCNIEMQVIEKSQRNSKIHNQMEHTRRRLPKNYIDRRIGILYN